jgi:hypothetical protein
MGGLPFDRVVLGGHEPSHHLSAGILQQLGVETGRIFGIWNENAVSSFLAGTKVYPKDSYAYKSIGLHNRENFIKFNYYFLNLKHLSKINEFRDNNKVIIKNSQEKELWQKELNIIYPDADKNMINLVKAAQLLNKIGMKIDNSHSQILNLADYIVNGKKNIRIDGMLDGKKIFFEHGQIISVDDTTNDKNSILGIRQWEQNPQKITSQIVDLDKTINNVNEISRKARSSSQDIHLDEFRRIFYAGNDSELFAQLQKKYPGQRHQSYANSSSINCTRHSKIF